MRLNVIETVIKWLVPLFSVFPMKILLIFLLAIIASFLLLK